MNKTININLGGTFFYIDEDAYNKLTRYLDAVKRSISDPQGKDEIIKDIEVRIAELFTEKQKHDKQVITIKEVEEVIAVMGQPEDYAVDDEMFEDSGKSTYEHKSAKKLFRDIDNKYLGGVSSGLGHYLGVDAVWMRLLWVILTIITTGTFALFYILFWILVPAAVTVADKLTMKGEPVNISNIERKFKESYDNVADKIKNADYDKYGKRVKSNTDNFTDALGTFFMALLTVFVKFIGAIILLVSSFTLIGLFIGLFITGVSGFYSEWFADAFVLGTGDFMPFWLLSIVTFLAIGIPFFALFILGLKIIVPHLKPMSKVAKLTFLGVWILAIGTLIFFGVRQAVQVSHTGNHVKTERLDVYPQDTLYVGMHTNRHFERDVHRRSGVKVKYDENDQKVHYYNNVRLIVKSTKDSVAAISVDRIAKGKSYDEARARAQNIEYGYRFTGEKLLLDGYFLTPDDQDYREQEVEITLYLPVGTILNADKNTYSFHRNTSYYGDILHNDDEGYYLEVLDGKTLCLDCPQMRVKTKRFEANWSEEEWDRAWEEDNRVEIGPDGININVVDQEDSVRVQIDRKGVRVNSNK